MNSLIHKKFILASSSASRYKILKNMKLRFVQLKPLCDEGVIKKNIKTKNTNPIYLVKKLSYEKAKSISSLRKQQLVVGCDTLIYFEKKILDKAKSRKEAIQKIMKLSGKKHKIYSAITIFKNNKKIWQCCDCSEVSIRKLSKKEISLYLNQCGNQILSSVGCYQIETLGPTIINNIKGDLFNVMGFPLFKFLKYLKG